MDEELQEEEEAVLAEARRVLHAWKAAQPAFDVAPGTPPPSSPRALSQKRSPYDERTRTNGTRRHAPSHRHHWHSTQHHPRTGTATGAARWRNDDVESSDRGISDLSAAHWYHSSDTVPYEESHQSRAGRRRQRRHDNPHAERRNGMPATDYQAILGRLRSAGVATTTAASEDEGDSRYGSDDVAAFMRKLASSSDYDMQHRQLDHQHKHGGHHRRNHRHHHDDVALNDDASQRFEADESRPRRRRPKPRTRGDVDVGSADAVRRHLLSLDIDVPTAQQETLATKQDRIRQAHAEKEKRRQRRLRREAKRREQLEDERQQAKQLQRKEAAARRERELMRQVRREAKHVDQTRARASQQRKREKRKRLKQVSTQQHRESRRLTHAVPRKEEPPRKDDEREHILMKLADQARRNRELKHLHKCFSAWADLSQTKQQLLDRWCAVRDRRLVHRIWLRWRHQYRRRSNLTTGSTRQLRARAHNGEWGWLDR